MYKIGLSTFSKRICEELFEQYSKAGITAMEISPNHDEYSDVDYKLIKEQAEKYDIDLWSFHLPFYPFTEIDISNPNTYKATVNYCKDLIEKASDIGIKRFIIHASGEPITDEERSERMKYSKESLALLADIAKKNGSVIAVEDLPRSCLGKNSDEIAELISASDDLMVCFDTNHLLNEDPTEFIHKLGNRIITTHISDYDFINERHWLPGEGKLDWKAILKAFKDIDYKGVWLYEVASACPKTIIRDRDLTCEDFVKNAKEIFEGKDITVFSTPKENLGMWG